jgi:PAS domain S-box-containing protein
MLEEKRRQYRDLFENVPTGVYRTTPDGRILMANSALIRMLGYCSLEELACRNLEKEGFAAP